MASKLILLFILFLAPIGCQTVNLTCQTTTGEQARTSSTMRDTDTQSPSTTATVPLR